MKQLLYSLSMLWLLVLLAAGPAAAQNLVVNPSFDAGNTGFTSLHTFVPYPGPDPGAGSYTIGPDNRAFNSNFLASYGDHTTGTGNYLIVNAAITSRTVWEQTVTGLQANQTYQFSFWLLNTFPTSKARMQVSANDTDVGPVFTNPNDGGNWQLNTVNVTPGAGTSLKLTLRNLNLDGNGNDFGLDDFALVAPQPNPQLNTNDVTTAPISTAATTNPTLISPLSATITGPAGTTVRFFGLSSVPSVGTLRVGPSGPALTAGAVLTVAEGGQLYYSPAGTTTQNVTFSYSAIDSNGNFDATPATYTIPLVAPAPPAGCQPAYAGGLAASGLSADYYPGYFNDDLSFFANTTPGLRRIDPQLNFSGNTTDPNGWGSITPPATGNGADPNQFSTRHRGSIRVPVAGTYTFYLTSDDASYLWVGGSALAPTLGNATINNSGRHGDVTVTGTVTLAAGLHEVLVYYGEDGGGNTLRLEYAGPAGSGIGRQVVPNAALCAGPAPLRPVAQNVTNAPVMPSTNGPTGIAPLAGTDPTPGGGVTSYRVSSLPPAASGILYVGNPVGTLPVEVNQVLTAAEAATLNFDPEAGFDGAATFLFFARNAAGIESAEAAIYTIPVAGPIADVTTTLSGPATLGAGQSSGTFTVTFRNNGPQAASQVTRTVRLPTGASMSAAQRAALPATASYDDATNTINFGTVAALNSGAESSFSFSFTVPTAQGAANLLSTVGTSTSQGANAAADQFTFNVTIGPGNRFVTSDDSNEVAANTAKSGNVILNDNNPANLPNSAFTAVLLTSPTKGTLVFNADGSYTYTPNSGATGPDSFTYRVDVPTAVPVASNTSTVTLNLYNANLVCTIGTGINLLVNPSFTQGNTGFTSAYGFVADDPARNNELVPEALYSVGTNAFNYHPQFAGFGRRGAGDSFMMVNGSADLSVVYQQVVAVRPNTYYSFSAFANSINPGSPAQLGFVINGKSTSVVTTLDGTTNYVRIADLWFSGSNSTAVLEIRDVNKTAAGNDFGLDDLYFGTCTKGLLANDVTNATLSNAAPARNIMPLRGTVTFGPAVGSFTVRTLPAASAGVLTFNGLAVVPDQVLLLSEANQLFFDPQPTFSGTATFLYSATDESGAGSDNIATYSLPVDERPLPVELLSFAAQALGRDARLNWRTATETNNDYFELQRSLDGRTFGAFGRVAGAGTSSRATDYAHTDAGIGATTTGPVYYRLRQVDRDGSFAYSPVRTVSFDQASAGKPGISLFPNPATPAATTTLDLGLLPAGTYQVRVLDALGRQVLTATAEGGKTTPLDLRASASGTYIVLVRAADGRQFGQRLVKE